MLLSHAWPTNNTQHEPNMYLYIKITFPCGHEFTKQTRVRNPFNVSLCTHPLILPTRAAPICYQYLGKIQNSFRLYSILCIITVALGLFSINSGTILQRSTVDNPYDIGRLAFTGLHKIFYKDKSKQDSHRTNVARLNYRSRFCIRIRTACT